MEVKAECKLITSISYCGDIYKAFVTLPSPDPSEAACQAFSFCRLFQKTLLSPPSPSLSKSLTVRISKCFILQTTRTGTTTLCWVTDHGLRTTALADQRPPMKTSIQIGTLLTVSAVRMSESSQRLNYPLRERSGSFR